MENLTAGFAVLMTGGVVLTVMQAKSIMTLKSFKINGKPFNAERKGLTAEKIVEMEGILRLEKVRAVRQHFVDGERQRYWPIGWNEEVDSLEDGDWFVIELGERIPVPDDSTRDI